MNKKEYIEDIFAIKRDIKRLSSQFLFQNNPIRGGVHPSQFPIMGLLFEKQLSTQSDIARELGISSATVGRSIMRLEKAGLVEKRSDDLDMRATRIVLTEQGKKNASEARENFSKLSLMLYDGFSEKELESCCLFMKRMRDNLAGYFEDQEKKAYENNR